MASFMDFAQKYPKTTGILGNVALGYGQTALENKLGLNDDFTHRYYENSSGHPILGEMGSEIGLGLLHPAMGYGMIGSSIVGGGLKYINKKAGGVDLYGDGDLGQLGDLMEHPGRGLKFAFDNTAGRLFHGGKLAGRGYTSDDDADVKFGDSAKLAEINENGGLADYYTILTSEHPELKPYLKPIDSSKYLGLTMDQLRSGNVAANTLSHILSNGGRYNQGDMMHFMTSLGLDPSIVGISELTNGGVGVDLSPEFYKEFVLSDYYKGDKNAELKRLGFDPQKVFAEQHAKEVKQQQDNDNTTDSKEQGKTTEEQSTDQQQQGKVVDDSPTIEKHEKNTVESTQQPNVHKNNATDQYLQYLMYRDYQKDKQRAESQKDMGLIPLLLAAYGMAKIGG